MLLGCAFQVSRILPSLVIAHVQSIVYLQLNFITISLQFQFITILYFDKLVAKLNLICLVY